MLYDFIFEPGEARRPRKLYIKTQTVDVYNITEAS
jgi:hypothetical protein